MFTDNLNIRGDTLRSFTPARLYPYLVAAVIAASFSLFGRLALTVVTFNPVIFVITGIIVAAWIAGPGPGVFASVVVAVLIRPLFTNGTPVRYEFADLIRLAFFLGLTFLISYLIGARKRAEAGLLAANAALEQRVQERTAELLRANHKLEQSNEELARERARVQSANDELQRLNKDLEQFMYSASHDLREPIRNVVVYSQLIERRYIHALDENGREYLSFIHRGARRLDRLLSDLLSYSRATGPDSDHPDAIDSNRALQSALADLAEAIRETSAEIHIDSLPPVHIRESHLEQVFLNLLGNALKYRGPRVPIIRISCHFQDHCCFAVQDNGIGIEPEYKEKIFGLFKRLHLEVEYPGTGIGLAICQRLVERYGGKIWVESVPGAGSTFFFTVPSAVADSSASLAAAAGPGYSAPVEFSPDPD